MVDTPLNAMAKPWEIKREERFIPLGLVDTDVIQGYKDGDMPVDVMLEEGLYSAGEFNSLINNRNAYAALDSVTRQMVERQAALEMLQNHYVLFEDFLHDCMTELMGFNCTDMQIDIGRFVSDKTYRRLMIQAQRAEAKSTIVAIFSVWQLVHDPKHRILIISAGSDVAMEIANWVIQIIQSWDILECLRPDRSHGDRASTKAFDINWMLKGVEKSPSVACIGVTANMQGRRADTLIADDIESSKNGLTEIQRLQLEHLTKDFASICQKGRIIFLGTPQSADSIYKNLPLRGYKVRIWPGRYPTPTELPRYGDALAPYVMERIIAWPACQTGGGIDGTRGWATDPALIPEDVLCEKEIDQGPEYFQLQHMLDTSLMDEGRHPLRAKDLIIMDIPMKQAPGTVMWMPNDKLKLPLELTRHYSNKPDLYKPYSTSELLFDYEFTVVNIDPAGDGENADEVAVGCGSLLHGNVFVKELLGMQGGHSESNLMTIAQFILKHRPQKVTVEQNMGHGAFAAMLRPRVDALYKQNGIQDALPDIIDVWESKQKELRIIETLSPIMASHRLILDTGIIEYDNTSTAKYPVSRRDTYKLIHQITKITRKKGALVHDDRLDVIEGIVRQCVEFMAVDADVAMLEKCTEENTAWLEEWGMPSTSLGANHLSAIHNVWH